MYSSVPYDKELLLFLAIVIIPFVIVAVYAHRQEKKKMQRKKEPAAAIQVEPPQKPAEIVPQPEDPKVSALRSAARQSLQINLLALEAQRQMANIARLHRTDTTIRRNPQSDPYYRRAEWTQDGEDWRQDRF